MASLRRSPSAPENRFTQVPNEWARHPTMGPSARAVLLWLLSHKDGWTMSRASIVAQNAWLTDFQARKALDELETLRILFREDEQQRERGQFGTGVWHIIYPGDPYPSVGSQPAVTDRRSPSDGGQPLKEDQQEDQKKTPSKPPTDTRVPLTGLAVVDESRAQFEAAWKLWPVKNDKKRAWARWQAAVPKRISAERVMSVVTVWSTRYATWEKNQHQYIRNFDVWLFNDSWDNELPPLDKGKKTTETAFDRNMRLTMEGMSHDTGRDRPAIDRSVRH